MSTVDQWIYACVYYYWKFTHISSCKTNDYILSGRLLCSKPCAKHMYTTSTFDWSIMRLCRGNLIWIDQLWTGIVYNYVEKQNEESSEKRPG